MRNKLIYMIPFLAIVLLVVSCKDSDYYYGEYLKNGEVYYPGRIDSLSIIPGDRRANLRFRATTDPKVNQIKVYLRNSLSPVASIHLFPIAPGEHGKFKQVNFDQLEEATYTANVFSFTAAGDSSRMVSTSQFVFGESYIRTLVNRNFQKFDNSNPQIPFLVLVRENNLPREGTFYPMQFTEAIFENNSGESVTVKVTPYNDFIELKDIKNGTTVKYRTVFKPVKNSIDYFYTEYNEVVYKK